MVQPVGPARADHREVVGAGGDVRQPVGDPDPALAVLLPLPPRGQQRRTAFSHGRDHRLEARRQRLAGQPVELGLGVERIEWLGPPSMKRKITLLAVAGRRHGADLGDGDRRFRSSSSSPGPADPPARQGTEARAGLEQPVAAGQRRHSMRNSRVHVGPFRLANLHTKIHLSLRAHGKSQRVRSWSPLVFKRWCMTRASFAC